MREFEIIYKSLGKSKYVSCKFYSSLKQTQSTLSSYPKNANPIQKMILKLKGRYGRVGTRTVLPLLLLLLLSLFHLSMKKKLVISQTALEAGW